jgi:hypothetical protein
VANHNLICLLTLFPRCLGDHSRERGYPLLVPHIQIAATGPEAPHDTGKRRSLTPVLGRFFENSSLGRGIYERRFDVIFLGMCFCSTSRFLRPAISRTSTT